MAKGKKVALGKRSARKVNDDSKADSAAAKRAALFERMRERRNCMYDHLVVSRAKLVRDLKVSSFFIPD